MARVLYLGGLGRSGTTLVERLLGELPNVCALGEVVHLWQRDIVDDERCGCGESFSRCAFWTAVGKRDYNVVQATVLLVVLGFVLINLLTDVVYAYLDPRIRYR